jgi:CheY-like chemotaxis protein
MDKNPLHIILADDDESDRLTFQEALAESRIKTIVYAVNDGEELMEHLVKEDTLIPHMLFLDMNMPRKNGLTCLKEIRNSEKLKNVAVAIYSTSSSERDIEETFNHGANVYIKKPTDFKILKHVLDKVLTASSLYKEPPFSMSNFIFRI